MDKLEHLRQKLANNKEVIFKIRVWPNAGNDEVRGEGADGSLKIGIAAPPTDNKANLALQKFLAQKLGLRRYQVEIIKGHTEKIKTIKISR